MSSAIPPSSSSYLVSRLHDLVLSSPPSTSLFYSRIWHYLSLPGGPLASSTEAEKHQALHALAQAFLIDDEPYSAIHLVRDTAERYQTVKDKQAGSSRYMLKPPTATGCLGCATILAKACESVGRWSEAAKVLERAMRQHPDSDPQLPEIHSIASPHLLLARMSQKSKDADVAAEGYTQALQDNPWLWEAYTSLCDMGMAPLPDYTFPEPPTAHRSSSTATLRPSSASAPREAIPSIASTPQNGSLPTQHGISRLHPNPGDPANPFHSPVRPTRGWSPNPAAESAGPSRKTTQLGGRPMHGGLWEGLTPGGEIDDSILGGRAGMGHGAGAMLGQAQGGLFTPDPGMMMGGVAGGRGGPPAVGAKVQMLGRSQWDTPSSAGDMSVPSIQPPRRTLPIRSATSHASSTSAASSTTVTPATSTSNPSAVGGPPAMKRARGPARHAHTLAQDYDTPINGHASSTTHPHAAPTRAQPATGRDRDLKSIEQNASSTADADLPPRRSSRLKVALPGTKVGRTLNTTLAPGDRDKKGVPGIMSRSTTATSASGTDVTSPSGAETRPLSPISASSISHPQSAPTDASLQRGADVYLLSIVRAFALSYRSLSTFALAQAISALDSLPPCLQHSPLALSIIAIAFYEQSDYIRSRRAFEALYALESYSLIGVHLFSTLLWHLADAPASSHLSQHAVSISKDRAEVWVAVGNTLSLGGDREGALRCFMRATAVGVGVRAGRTGVVGLKSLGQGDRVRAYAYTLAGYECVELEEFERGVEMYRLAIRTDGRLYNAWYGLGQAYMKMSKPKYAEHHFRRAVEMNPGNPILLCCLGQVLEAQEDNRAALAIYTRAASLHLPSSSNSTSTSNANVNTYNPLIPPLVQFKRIRVLIVLSRLPEALALLEPLAKALPDEAQVLLLLGKCYLAMGRRKEGVQALTEARELVPRLGSKVGGLIGGEGESEEED